MRVPINPQTNVPGGELGYEKAVDHTAGIRALTGVVQGYADYAAQEQKKREMFDVQKALVDETNNIQQDFEDKTKAQPLGAPNFTQQVNGEYNTRHQQLIDQFKQKGYSDDAINEFTTRLGSLRSSYVAKAIDFQEKSHYAKAFDDADQLTTGLAQYANKNWNAVGSAVDELHVAVNHLGLDAIESDKLFNAKKGIVLQAAREGLAVQHPEIVLGLYGLPGDLTTTSPTELPAGQEFSLPNYLAKTKGAEGTGKNPKSSAIGYFQFTDSTWRGTYKAVFGNTGESDAQILAKKKDLGVATKLAEKLTNDNIAKLTAAQKPVNDATVYLAHFLGVDGAIKVLSAHADASIAALIGNSNPKKDPIRSNPNVFNKVKTVGDMLAWTKSKMGVDPTQTAPANSPVQMAVLPIPKGWHGNQEDAIQELGMTAEQAATYLSTGKDPRKGPKTGMLAQGNIDVSQIVPVQNPDGSVSTVRSISIGVDGKEYLIPTVVNGKVVSNEEAIASFRETGKHLGVFTDAKSADRYAQQLHESEAKRVTGQHAALAQYGIQLDENGKTGIDALDLSTPTERTQMLTLARTVMNEREATARAGQRQAHETYINDFYNKLQDGKLGQADLDQAYNSGQITDFDERKKAQGIIDSKIKKDDDLTLFHAMLQSGGKFNPYDDKAQKAVDAGFDQAVKYASEHGGNAFTDPFTIALRSWQRTGILPTRGAQMIRGGLVSTDPNQVAAAASIASNMLKQNPNAFAGVDGGEEIGKAAAAYAHYVDDHVLTSQEAANKVAQMNSPEYQAKVQADKPAREQFQLSLLGDKTHPGINIEKVLNDEVLGKQGVIGGVYHYFAGSDRGTFTDTQKAEANQTYTELALDHYDKFHDPAAAQAYAARQMGRFYGVEGGRLVKFPPSKAYPDIMGSREYVYDQAKQFVDHAAGFPVPKENIILQPAASGATAQAFRQGKPTPYEILYKTQVNGQDVYHHIPGKLFVADVDQARKDAAQKARAYEQKSREVNAAGAAFGVGL